MPNETGSYLKFDHDAYARTRARDDFWGQIRRTVRGTPVSEAQIQLIVDVVMASLQLDENDILLDLACGNGALSQRLFNACAEVHGVDLSEFLISVAKENFERVPRFLFKCADAVEYLRAETSPERFTKVLCYGSFSYFSKSAAEESLALLHDKFVNVKSVFIGNLPDRSRAADFYTVSAPSDEELIDHASAIGIWRSHEEFIALAKNTGWCAEIKIMPEDFWAAHYRYDVLLSRDLCDRPSV